MTCFPGRTAPRGPARLLLAAAGMALGLLAGCGPESYWPGNGGAGGFSGGVGGHLGGAGGLGAGGGADGGAADVPPVTVHFDFESSVLDGWQSVGGPRPPDVIDQVTRSTDAFHHGTSSLAMVLDGQYTPLGATESAYYGVYTPINAPPPNVQVSVWAMSTAPGVAILIYTQLKPSYLWQALTISDVLPVNVWTKVTVTMPTAEAFYIGCLLMASSYDAVGTVYLDDISW